MYLWGLVMGIIYQAGLHLAGTLIFICIPLLFSLKFAL